MPRKGEIVSDKPDEKQFRGQGKRAGRGEGCCTRWEYGAQLMPSPQERARGRGPGERDI